MRTSQTTEPSVHDRHWKAVLSLSFEEGPSRTIVRRNHSGPLNVQRPLYPEGSVAHVYMLHPPGGMVGGDDLSIIAQVSDKAAGLVTTPGATKFYRTNGVVSRIHQRVKARGGSIEWFPQENIFFNRAVADVTTHIEIHGRAAFAGWDIQCFGRIAGDEPFVHGSVSNNLIVSIDDQFVFCDRLVVNDKHPLSLFTTLRGNTVVGTFIMNRMPIESVEIARAVLSNHTEFYVTHLDSLLLIRYLGSSAESAKSGFAAVWSRMRKTLNHRAACEPRIWST